MNKFDELRANYPSFCYDDYKIKVDNQTVYIDYYYHINRLDCFVTHWTFPCTLYAKTKAFDKLVFSLGLVEAISYYKLTCSKDFNINCGSLTKSQEEFFKKLFYNGLGEFMFKNNIKISMDELVDFHYEEKQEERFDDFSFNKGVLVPVGGGKDSCVSIELLKDKDIKLFSINSNKTINNVIKQSGIKWNINATRHLDERLLYYNSEGFLNGHTPFSAIVAFSSYIAAYLNGLKYIALSNESSANESTVPGSFVNHQYSKSLEFENDFINYTKSLSKLDIHYFSFLRPLKEIQIAKLFSKLDKYHSIFRSCNVGSKEGVWCSNCAKCLFVYIILCPFIKEDKLIEIFGKKVLDNKDLEEDFKGLIGINENKPFECVGTRLEVLAALNTYIKSNNSYLADKYKEFIIKVNANLDDLLKEYDQNNNVPDELVSCIKEAL